eukprot:GFYU01005259.1.p1 GENE.GFYU01005259.1~~GFYU01005259.1.p1  ORF type:complete len:370 (-),score=83.13 GFYU01005259.1:124-1233(-)
MDNFLDYINKNASALSTFDDTRKPYMSVTTGLPIAPSAINVVKRRCFVKNACVNCRKAKSACDHQRPCARCVRLQLEDSCFDVQHRKCGRPRKDRPHPYKDENNAESKTTPSAAEREVKQAAEKPAFTFAAPLPQPASSAQRTPVEQLIMNGTGLSGTKPERQAAEKLTLASNSRLEEQLPSLRQELESRNIQLSRLGTILDYLNPPGQGGNTAPAQPGPSPASGPGTHDGGPGYLPDPVAVVSQLGESQELPPNIGVCFRAVNGNVLFANDMYYQLFQVPFGQIAAFGSSWGSALKFVPTACRDAYVANIRNLLSSPQDATSVETQYHTTMAGHMFPAVTTTKLIRSPVGHAMCFIVTVDPNVQQTPM